MTDVIVIGGGPAGMMAAITAAERGAKVCLMERNQKVGRKLYITGKGRCNVTNDADVRTVLEHIPRNGRFVTSAVTRFPPESVKAFFEKRGVALKVERGGRVFPVSDKAADIVDALFLSLRRSGVELLEDRAEELLTEDGAVRGVRGEHGTIRGKAVILATGGASYPLTGSTGDGYTMAEKVGHTIVPPQPSLVPLETAGEDCRKMQGLSLRNVAIRVKNQKKKVIYAEQGEMLFTHFGVTGPLILSASAHMRDFAKDKYTIFIDLKPALDEEKLDQRLLRDFGAQANRAFHNVLEGLLPRLMVPVMVERCAIPGDLPVHSVTKAQRRRLLEELKSFRVEVTRPRPIAEAIVTSGGVKTGEVDPHTMASKKMPGLYLAGELLDVDGYTGGFNLQIAWSTGRAAGEAAAEAVLGQRE